MSFLLRDSSSKHSNSNDTIENYKNLQIQRPFHSYLYLDLIDNTFKNMYFTTIVAEYYNTDDLITRIYV